MLFVYQALTSFDKKTRKLFSDNWLKKATFLFWKHEKLVVCQWLYTSWELWSFVGMDGQIPEGTSKQAQKWKSLQNILDIPIYDMVIVLIQHVYIFNKPNDNTVKNSMTQTRHQRRSLKGNNFYWKFHKCHFKQISQSVATSQSDERLLGHLCQTYYWGFTVSVIVKIHKQTLSYLSRIQHPLSINIKFIFMFSFWQVNYCIKISMTGSKENIYKIILT